MEVAVERPADEFKRFERELKVYLWLTHSNIRDETLSEMIDELRRKVESEKKSHGPLTIFP